MSRTMPGTYGFDQTPQTATLGGPPYDRSPQPAAQTISMASGAWTPERAQSIYSINLPPQYRDKMEQANYYPDEMDLRLPFQSLTDIQAAQIVRHDFENAANYRYQNHDWRWTVADTLYTGWKSARYWDGTKIPRSALSVLVAFEQIESLMPRVMNALFGETQWFEAIRRGRTTPESARAVRDILVEQLEYCGPRSQMRQVIKSGVTYGNGILSVGWDYQSRNVMQFIPEFVPRMKTIWHPIDGRPIEIPSKEFDRVVREFELEEVINRPYMEYVPLKRWYVDPNAPGPIISGPRHGARFTCIESYMTIDELDALRKTSGFEGMPDNIYLQILAKEKPYHQSDMTQSEQESARRSSWMPWVDQSVDPAAARVKVIHYFTAERIIWSLNNQLVVFNKPNSLGKIAQYNCYYADLLDRLYAMAISDIVEPEQRFQEASLNARVDEIALGIHPQTVKQRGNGTPVYQVRVRPGGVSESQDPKNDVIRQYPMNITQASSMETLASRLRVQSATGVTDLAAIGIGSSANPGARSATGAGLQGQATITRIQYFVENVEADVLEPALTDVYELDKRHLDPNQMIQTAAGAELDPIVIWGSQVRFGMRAASRMQSRAALVQLLPMMLQSMLNPQLQQQLLAMGKTVDFIEVMQMIMDATGYREKTQWVRDVTPQEAKQLNKPSKADTDMMLQQDRMARLREMQLNKQEMDMLTMLFKSKFEMEKEKFKLAAQAANDDGEAGGEA